MVLLDVNPLSLGVETRGGLVARVIPRNTIIPASGTQIFTTAKTNQTSMDINVLQGERELAADNICLGRLDLTGIQPQPQGRSRVEVDFSIDADGILTVAAIDLHTDHKVSIHIDSANLISESMISEAIMDAEKHFKSDAENKKKIETLIKAENLVTTVDELIKEKHEQLPEGLLPDLNSLVLDLKNSLQLGDVNDIDAGAGTLTRFISDIGIGR